MKAIKRLFSFLIIISLVCGILFFADVESHADGGNALGSVVVFIYERNGVFLQSRNFSAGYALKEEDVGVPGYETSAWRDNAGQNPVSFPYTLTEDTTIYIERTKTVTMNPNGGTVPRQTHTIYYNKPFGALPTPSKTGYSFQGWFTGLTGGEKVTRNTVADSNPVNYLYAHWSPKQITVTFDANGGSVLGKSKTVQYGSLYGELPVPSRPGFCFAGWKYGNGFITGNSTVTTAINHTLTAQWSDREITEIQPERLPDKTSYEYGDAFNSAGLKIRVIYSNGETEIVSNGFECSPAVLTQAGQCEITASYGTKECRFNVDVCLGAPVSVEIQSLPSKLEYQISESPDCSGLKLIAVYKDGSTQLISSGFNCNPSVFENEGTYRVSVEYEGFVNTFFVNVLPRTLSGISVTTMPDKTVYSAGETFDPQGMVVTAFCSDGYNYAVSDYSVDCNLNVPVSPSGTQVPVTVTYSYNGSSYCASFNVLVCPAEEQSVNRLAAADCTGSPGDEITIPVSINDNVGFIGFTAEIQFDDNCLTPVCVTRGSICTEGLFDDSCGVSTDGRITVVYAGSESICCDEVLFYVKFTVKDEMVNTSAVGISGYSYDDSYNLTDFVPTGFNVNALYSGTPHLIIKSVKAVYGEPFMVPVYLKNAGGVKSVQVSLEYDVNRLVPVDSTISYDNTDGRISFNLNNTAFSESEPVAVFTFDSLCSESCSTGITCSEITYSMELQTDLAGRFTNGTVEISAVNENEPVAIYIENIRCAPGETITVPVRISNNPGVCSMQIAIEYNPEVLTFSGLENGELFSVFDYNEMSDSCLKMVFSGVDDVTASNGTVVNISFRVSSTFLGFTDIVLSCIDNDIYKADGTQLDVNANGSAIYTKEPEMRRIYWHFGENVYITEQMEGTMVLVPKKTPKYYTVVGWIPELPATMPYQDIHLTAILAPTVYEATFKIDGVTVSTQEYTIETDDLVKPDIPPKPYSFARWQNYNLKKGGDLEINAVYDPPKIMAPAQKTLHIDETYRIVTSGNFAAESYSWESDDESVATVDAHGIVTAVSSGTTKITVIRYGKDLFGNKISARSEINVKVTKEKVRYNSFAEWLRAFVARIFDEVIFDVLENIKKSCSALAILVK